MKLNEKTAIGCIILLCIMAYIPILGNKFMTAWDDGWQVINNYTETLSWYNIKLIFTDYYYGQYSPVNQFLYTVIYYFFGYDSVAFHLFSLLLHTLNALLVFFIVRQLLIKNISQGSKYENKIVLISLGTALLFAIHPLQVEAVAWLSASKILVCSFFYLLGIWFYLSYIQKGKTSSYIFMLLCFILSFGGKEQAVTFPVCLFWIDLACRRNFRNEMLWYEKMPVILLTILFAYITMESNASVNVGLLGNEDVYPFIYRMVFTCYSFCEYIVKILFPFNLLYIYPFPMTVGETLPAWFWMYPVLLLVIGVCFWKFLTQRPVWLGLTWFLIHIGLMLHVLPLSRPNIVADRYIYLASPGIFFIIAWYFFVVLEMWPRFRKVWIGLAFTWLIFLGVKTHIRTHTWHDNKSLKMKMSDLLEQRKKKPYKFEP